MVYTVWVNVCVCVCVSVNVFLFLVSAFWVVPWNKFRMSGAHNTENSHV